MTYLEEIDKDSAIGLQVLIEIKSIDGMTSQERALAISKELFKIQYPNIEYNGLILFPIVYNEIGLCLSCSLDAQMHVPVNSDLTDLILLFPNLSDDEKNYLIDYIKNNNYFIFSEIIPMGTKIYTLREIVD